MYTQGYWNTMYAQDIKRLLSQKIVGTLQQVPDKTTVTLINDSKTRKKSINS